MHPEELKSDAGSFVVKIKCCCDFILSFLVNSYFIFQCEVTFGNYIDFWKLYWCEVLYSLFLFTEILYDSYNK